MAGSRTDRFYRSFLLSKLFTKGWGRPDHLKRIFQLRQLLGDRERCMQLVDRQHPVTINKEWRGSGGDFVVLEGEFVTPFVHHCGGGGADLLPSECRRAHFQAVLPTRWRDRLKPTVLHLAGTGDHYFWRRRSLLAVPLVREAGIGSLILENPFYGHRKPHDQVRSSLRFVSDLFVMGACLILESISLFHWAERNGLGPLGISGVSMGGHMASLAASVWPRPLPLIPCLSWTSASSVFTTGVMSNAIDWQLLERQYVSDHVYRNELRSMVHVIDSDNVRIRGDRCSEHVLGLSPRTAEATPALSGGDSEKLVVSSSHITSPPSSAMTAMSSVVSAMAASKARLVRRPSSSSNTTTASSLPAEAGGGGEAVLFMRALMDEATHLANFPVPVDPELVIVVRALHDAYVPGHRLVDMRRLWPGCTVRNIDTGHVGAYLFNQATFRQAIRDAFDLLVTKYNLS